ncbi:hypothetical protein CHGG_00257 [Chaetomium globosum CBS 148.51]|uniref:Mid2 domain-containing protein n=1 Tax=Chaetomium globosum (strain ATCC 6205 / CBS 148.51 / DSM 1962 / NBRC 6347 / NRRL 1970) TaxID=306901 RepID=Q2HHP7_CHAGB|nr:uncharacterized protein CHGG_00257 [Chaetomium globosum CBS 148.51]EAQ92022.1 hypothetical protein CHGG_00257 [Chaetomium globosum CBS 148.51]
MRLSWGLTVSCILFFTCICVAQDQCYAPNGQTDDNFFPCDPNATHSTCCNGRSTCLSNKLCMGPDGNLIRGLCTDKNWQSPECAYYCMSAIRGGHDLISCSNVTNTDTSFCCDGHRAFCCDDGVARFNVLPSNPQAWATWDNSASHFVVVQDLKTTSTGSLPAATGTSTTPSTTPPAATTDSDQTQSAPTSPTATDTSTPSESPQSTTLPIAAQAGIGVGIGALAIALAAVAYLLWKLRRSKKALLAEKEQSNNGAGALGYLHAATIRHSWSSSAAG